MNLAFRVDSSNLIGSGHVRRCLKLAEELKYKCNKIIFITKNFKDNFNNLIKKKKFKLVLIKNNISKKNMVYDLNSTKKICKKHAIDVLIKDHYHLNSVWEKKIKKNINKLVVVDDFTKKKHHCDIIFNNLNNENIDRTKHYSGLEFVIIPNKMNKKKTRKKNISKETKMTLIQRNVEQLRREGIKNSKQFKEQKNFYDTDQALTEFEDMLQSNHLITHKSKYLEYLKTSGRDDYDSFQIRTLGKFLSEVINDIKIAYEIKD